MRLQGNLVHPVARSFQLVVCSTLLMLIGTVHAQTYSGAGERTDSLIVEEASGAVKIKLANRWQSPTTGMIVSLPAGDPGVGSGQPDIDEEADIQIGTGDELDLSAREPGVALDGDIGLVGGDIDAGLELVGGELELGLEAGLDLADGTIDLGLDGDLDNLVDLDLDLDLLGSCSCPRL